MEEFSQQGFIETWKQKIEACKSLEDLEEIRVHLLGKNGFITHLLKSLNQLSPEERRSQGAFLNKARDELTDCLIFSKKELELNPLEETLKRDKLDLTLPSRPQRSGSVHLITQTLQDIHDYLNGLGFQTVEGPEIEDEYHNFDALNIPSFHPSRQDQDTFFLKNHPNLLLRTQTSNTQIRTLNKQKPPLRMISSGRVYRSDNLDATHTPMFHQLEGLVIEPHIHIGHLKGCLTYFCQKFFNNNQLEVRFRPSFFPFTEPSLEVDILYSTKKNEKKWLEVLGAGMIHPNVLQNCNIDPHLNQGFAFGMGIERLIMLKYELSDIRQLYHPDQRWLKHYGQSC